ncbi:hypothetical protein Tco_1392860 [Tanacetum coccineum]
MATPSKAANGVNETSETPSVKRRMETPVYPSAVGSKTPGQNGKFSQPCKLFQASYTPQANQKSLTPLRKTPTTFSQPLSVKKFSRRLCKTSDQNPDHPLSKYATLIDSEDTHYPMFGNTLSIATEVTSDSLFTSSLNEVGLPQSPLVSPTAPLPLHQSNVDVAATFGVVDVAATFGGSLSTVGDLEFASRPGESDGTRNVSSDSITVHTSSPVEEVVIHSIDDVTPLFGLSLNSLKDINEFTKDLESTSYAGAAGASSEDQPKVNSNFHPLVADPVFYFVNISIPRKFIEKVTTCFEHTLYGYIIGKRLPFPVIEYYARNNWVESRKYIWEIRIGDCARVGLNESKADGCGKRMVVSDSYKNTSTITAEKKPRGKKAMAPYEKTPQYPCSNLILVESSFGMIVKTSMDGPAGLVFGPAGVALGPAELAQKTPN